ncbi:hypothetical protein [Gloeocapsopsis dulcis]|nr:hypothetical protein [Gloeocapsopsis dulcis]WNN91379.1 hypothetical protein P0S91_10040 [Gloeocapsopsis dulcis]
MTRFENRGFERVIGNTVSKCDRCLVSPNAQLEKTAALELPSLSYTNC